MLRHSVFAGVALIISLSLWSASARAQEGGDEPAASAQFDRGLKEMQEGRYDTGCPALAESYRLDPKAGALFTLAECESKWGKVASAVAHYDDFLRLVERMTPARRQQQQQRETVARSQSAELRPRVPMLTINLAKTTPPQSVVTRDGVVLGAASRAVPLPIDPGEHVIVLEAPDGSRREERVILAAGERKVVTLDLPSKASAPASTPVIDSPPTTTTHSSRSPWPYVAFGTAAVAAGLGAVTGVLVLGKKSEIEDHCVGTTCSAEGKDAADSGQSLAMVSTISFAVAGAALALGVVLLLTSPGGPRPAAQHSPMTNARWVGAPGGIGMTW